MKTAFVILMIVTAKPDGTHDFSLWSFADKNQCEIVAAKQKSEIVETFCLNAPAWEQKP